MGLTYGHHTQTLTKPDLVTIVCSAINGLSYYTVTIYKMWGRSEARERDHTILADLLFPYTCA